GACIGSRFQLRTIATISKKSLYQIATDLWPAIQAGLLLVVGDGHQIIQKAGLEIDWGQIPLEFDIEDQFLHDRVQQAAYELIDLGQRKKVHLKTGRLLLESATKDQIEGRVFTIVRQFNEGQELIDSTKEKIRLAELNLDAGKKAKQSTAYRAAAEYLRTGVDLLPKNSWSEHYQLTFELYKEHAECEYLIGNHSIAENRFDLIVENVISKHDQAEIYLLRMVLYFLQNRYTASLRIGLEALQLFGIELPEHPTKEYIQKELVQTRQQQGQIPFSDISRALPICKDKDQEYVIQLLSRMSPAAYLTNPELFSALLIRSTYIAFKHGVTKDSSHSFCGYAIILGGVLGDYSSAYECGKASFELNLKFQNFKFEGRTYMLFSAFINHWKMPFESNLQLHQKGYQTCLDAGDLRFVCYTILFSFWQKWSKSSQLSILKDEYQRHLLFLKKVNDQNTINQTEMFLGMIHSLQTDSVDEKSWNTKTFNEKQYLEKIKQDQYLYGINTYYILKLVMSYLWGDYDDALEYAQKAEETLKASVALLSLTDQCFFYFLTLAKLHENFSEEKQKESTEKRKKLVSQMEIWAENCPENFLHKLQLMQAKEFYLQGDFCESLNHYEKSIEQAKSQDFSRDIALASEECACFWLHQEKEKYARVNFVEAHYLYEQWGATKKAKQLEEKYPDFILLKKDQKNKSQLTISNSTYDGSPKSDYFDFRSVVKASQAISSQMVLSSLLKELMVIAVENAGAQKGLFLIKNNDSFIVKVQENVDHEEIKNGTITFPSSLVQYVFNTQKTLVLENASQDKLFLKDEYIQENSIKSLLCYPILHQGKVTGVLYLENNLLSGAFTPDQIEILDVLSSQAAISIENAQRYNTVEDKVTERTRELKSAQQRIIRLEKDATEVQMAGGFAHEIRNALGGAYSLAEIALYDDSEGTPPKSFCLQNSESLKELYLIIREIIPKEKLRDIAKIIGKINEREETLDEILRRIYDRTDRALGITNQIMEYSRIGKTEKGCDLISLQEVIQSVIDKELEEEFQRQNVNLILSLKPTHPIQGNLLHFHSIIKNLLFNARDAVLDMEDEQRRMIQVNLKETESEQILEVLDRGVGISKEGIDRVFEPFFSTKPETGTGLGLGMVFKFVSLYNGSIDVTSNPEGGETCFTVTLPIKSE
ncbi:MAG: histidine kinase, partial [bacterium]